MKKLIITLFLTFLLAFPILAYAAPVPIADSQLGFQKIGVETKYIKDVYTIFGKPDRKIPTVFKNALNQEKNGEILIWSGFMKILIDRREDTNEGMIKEIIVYNDRLVTPAGIHCGSTFRELKKAYSSHLGRKVNHNGNKIYYLVGSGHELTFTVDPRQNNKVIIMDLLVTNI